MRRTLHLCRGATTTGLPIAARDWIVALRGDALVLADHGEPPYPPGELSYDQLLELIRRAALIITW